MEKDTILPKSVGKKAIEPTSFPNKDEICRRLDEFYKTSGVELQTQPSEMFKGALYAMGQEHNDSNPDWMAQVAHSLREIIYNFEDQNNTITALKEYGSTYDENQRINIKRYHGLITEIAHHNFSKAAINSLIGGSKQNPITITRELFEGIVFQFGRVLFEVLRRQTDAHKEIDRYLEQDPIKATKDEINKLININLDAKQYLFHKADERWLSWLWENGLLDVIKQKSDDPKQYSYRTAELNYLADMSAKVPGQVVDIMLQVEISPETFNPEAIDQFLRISADLPPEQLSKLIPKIHDDKWIVLMKDFNHWGFEYEKIILVLKEAKDCKNLLLLADAILVTKSKEEIEPKNKSYIDESAFYFNELSYTKVFKSLSEIPEEYLEGGLKLTTEALTRISLLGNKGEESYAFELEDAFYLLDADFFTLELSQSHHSYRDDIRELVAVIKIIAERLAKKYLEDKKTLIKIYEKYIQVLPDSQLNWRLKLYFLSLAPDVYEEQIKDALYRLFDSEDYYDIIAGAEYEKLLQTGFEALPDEVKQEYGNKIIEYFNSSKEKDEDHKKWRHIRGSRILSIISKHLNPKIIDQAKAAGFKLDVKVDPRPSVGSIEGGFVQNKAPIALEEFQSLKVDQIAKKLTGEWSPEQLSEKYKNDNFLTPRNAEGIGDLLKSDISSRLQEYLNNSELFFDPKKLCSHYTYSLLRGFQEAIKNGKVPKGINWDGLIKLIDNILSSPDLAGAEQKTRKDRLNDTWLAGWASVHSAITDVIQELLKEHDGGLVIDFSEYHESIFQIISSLLAYPDPIPKDEELDTATSTTKSPNDSHPYVSEPFSMAINSVRGRAFEAFVYFINIDGKQYSKTAKVKMSTDTKKLYERVLDNEDTRAIRFMFGRYLPTFFYRDTDWLKGLLPKIFDDKKINLYTAAWEGYLSNNLYEELFKDPDIQKLYEKGLDLKEDDYPKHQKHFKKPDEGIATHLALAYMHYKDIDLDHPLLKKLLSGQNIKQKAEVISFIGRAVFVGDDAIAEELLKKNPDIKKRMKDLWDWSLDNDKDLEILKDFGTWVNIEKDIFTPAELSARLAKTLEKTSGNIEFGHSLIKSIIDMAEQAPDDAIKIARLFLLEGKENHWATFHVDEEWFEAIAILHQNASTKIQTETLINDLIREKGRIFWGLKKIIDLDAGENASK